jgi:signal transduction histidine kinase
MKGRAVWFILHPSSFILVAMSYRAFKRLLGETSLERKCRFLFGAFILVLITGSFWLYARQTEHLAYEQITNSCRLLVIQIVDRKLATVCRPMDAQRVAALAAGTVGLLGAGQDGPLLTVAALGPARLPAIVSSQPTEEEQERTTTALDQFRSKWSDHWPEALKDYQYTTIKPGAVRFDRKPDDPASAERLKAFQNNREPEFNQLILSKKMNYYYAAIRASEACLSCHRQTNPDLAENDLIAMIKIEMPTNSIENGIDWNRALLITTAFVTAIIIMIGSWLIVRYVIVKPVKHLKEVSDAIAAGELNVRSEIQTGDEFEDLSHAFNRMLRNLVSMQDRLRKVNTDLDRKVDELAQANLALYESNRLKSDFLATMSHELRTPLNSILGFSEVLQTSAGLSDKQQRWVGNIRTSGEQLLNLINDILDLAKIEAGKMQIRVTEFSSYDVCEGMLTMFRPLGEKKNIELRGQLAPDIPLVRQDVVKFQQILSNLLSNAIKFTPEGGRVRLEARSHGGFLEVTVSDTGVGIAEEEQELIFEKFRQSGNPLTREHAGTGLGLSIVRELSKLLGGEVNLQSELGRGSTFTVRLPMQLSPEQRLEFDLATEGVDLSKAQRIDVRQLYGGAAVAGQQPAVSD